MDIVSQSIEIPIQKHKMRYSIYFTILCKKVIFNPFYGNVKNIYSYRCHTIRTVAMYKVQIPPYHISSSGFHISNKLFVKSHQEKENEYAHSVMEKSPAYAGLVVKHPLEANVNECSSKSPQELKEFAQVTIQCIPQNLSLENKRFSSLIYNLIKIIPQLSDEDLIYCLHLLCCWPPTPKTWSPNFKSIWNKLDSECSKRLKFWDIQHKLLVADYWFQMRLNRISIYNRNMISSLTSNLKKLTDSEIVQLMFYVNLQREVSPLSLKALEIRLPSTIENISMEELGVICLGFFKTKNKIKDFSIVRAIINRFLNEVENFEEATTVSILKFLKKSMQLSYAEAYIPFLHHCVKFIHKWEVKTCVHVALLASECHVYHPLLLNSITERVACEIKNARLKDCMKLLQCLSHFNHRSSSKFNELFLLEIKIETRNLERSNYPRDLIYSALYYAYMGYYDYDLLNTVMNPDFVTSCISLFPETDVTFAEVDCCIEIECRDYDGYRLDKNHRQALKQKRSVALESDRPNFLTRISNEVMDSLEDLLGNKKTFIKKQILPHVLLPDIVVILSGDIKSLWCNDEYLFVPPKNVWVCFVLGGPFAFAYRSKHITGVTAMKLRQLEKLGYKVIFIPYFELPRDSIERKNFLKCKLDALKECQKFTLHVN